MRSQMRIDRQGMMRITLYNTYTRKKEAVTLGEEGQVRLYTCGPTVYNLAHIGNLRTYVHEDVLRRALARSGLSVRHVMNVTDVGHLASDADSGEDKMVLGARREGKTVWEIARFYEDAFFRDIESLNILRAHQVCRATEHVEDMIAFVKALLDRGYGYEVDGNIYFDTSKVANYGFLGRLDVDAQLAGARVEVDERKRSPRDFVLWFSKSKFPNQVMQWDSPWGRGFPGWHVECSVLAIKYLGERVDIHCGGIDHIPLHHTNELAQSEAYLGHAWCSIWMHCNFLKMGSGKMSKSAGGFVDLADVTEMGFEPFHYRYFCLGSHYRSELAFSDEGMRGAKNALERLRSHVRGWKKAEAEGGEPPGRALAYRRAFESAISDDLNTPVALSAVWNLARDDTIADWWKLGLVRAFDEVLGLRLDATQEERLSDSAMALIREREAARESRDWERSDRLRDELQTRGVIVRDTPTGTEWEKI